MMMAIPMMRISCVKRTMMMIVMIYESHVDDDDGSDNGFAVVVRLMTKEMERKYPTYLLGEGWKRPIDTN